MTSSFALRYDVHNVHCGLFRQSSSQRLIFVLYPSRLRQIKCKPVLEKKNRDPARAMTKPFHMPSLYSSFLKQSGGKGQKFDL